jgi:hypothetical protein
MTPLSASGHVKTSDLDAKTASKDAFFGNCWILFHLTLHLHDFYLDWPRCAVSGIYFPVRPQHAFSRSFRKPSESSRRGNPAPDQVSVCGNPLVQDNYWRLAQDPQIEARALRLVLRKISEEAEAVIPVL